jgi:hypothetical protein
MIRLLQTALQSPSALEVANEVGFGFSAQSQVKENLLASLLREINLIGI